MERLSREKVNSLFENVDCVHMRVSNLDEGLAFYEKALGLKLLWRTQIACGLGMKNDITEIVISTDDVLMVDMKVERVEDALSDFIKAGGKVESGPFDIDIGKCAVVADPWGNKYCILDTTKGTYDTDTSHKVNGVSRKINRRRSAMH